MASVGPTPPAGWYTDPQSPAQLRFWDGTNWTAQTSPAAAPPMQAPGGQGWGQGPVQPQSGGLITSLWPPRPGESADDALTRGLASYEQTSGWVWIAIGVLQVLLLITIIAGVWNIYVGINRRKLAPRIERRDPYIPASFESLTGYIVSGILNLVLGGVLGVALVALDLHVRDQVLKNRHLFAVGAVPAAPYGPATPGYAPGTPTGYGPGTPPGYGPGTPPGYGPGTPPGYGPGTPVWPGPGTPAGYGPGTPAGYAPGVPASPTVPPTANGPAFPDRLEK
jgi:hypothetical protein